MAYFDTNILVDFKIFKNLKNKKIYKVKRGFKFYSIVCIEKELIYLHRYVTDAPDNLEVDHINRNPLDNRASNLKLCNHLRNSQNKGLSRKNKTGVRGIAKYDNGFRVSYIFEGRYIANKRFKDFNLALEYLESVLATYGLCLTTR